MSDTPVYLSLNNKRFDGWSEASINRSLDSLADSFSLTYNGLPQALGVRVGSICHLTLGPHRLVTGHINSLDVSVQSGYASTTCSGRSKAGDLVDCAAIHKTGQWLKQSMFQIVTDLAAPFLITVTAEAEIQSDTFKFDRYEIDEGERVYDAMERLLRATGTIAVSRADGSIHLMRIKRNAGLRSVQLPIQHTFRRSYQHSEQDQYSTYRLRNQTMRANAEESPRHAALEKYEIKDEAVTRYRPYVLNSNTHARVAELQIQATWERNVRHGKSLSVSYAIPGGLAPDGKPWEPGMFVGVQDQELGINEILLLVSTEFRVTNSELDTTLMLSLPEAYSLLPLPARDLNRGVSLRG